jgi:hypothetical protein
VDTNSDEVAAVYDSGMFGEDTTFKQCQGSNLNDYYSPGSIGYIYPKGQRTYEFDSVKKEEGVAETGDIEIVSSDGATLGARGLLNFTLNTDCEILQRFHDRIGLKYGASEEGVGDWTALLNNYLGIPLRDTLKIEARKYTARDLYFDTDGARQQWIDDSIEALPKEVEELARGAYFTPNEFTLKIPDIRLPENLKKQIDEQLVQVERLATIDAQATASAKERSQMQALVELFGGWEGYIAYRNQLACEENAESCVPFIPIPQGTNITVPAN